jgi:hypothetical protein
MKDDDLKDYPLMLTTKIFALSHKPASSAVKL